MNQNPASRICRRVFCAVDVGLCYVSCQRGLLVTEPVRGLRPLFSGRLRCDRRAHPTFCDWLLPASVEALLGGDPGAALVHVFLPDHSQLTVSWVALHNPVPTSARCPCSGSSGNTGQWCGQDCALQSGGLGFRSRLSHLVAERSLEAGCSLAFLVPGLLWKPAHRGGGRTP